MWLIYLSHWYWLEESKAITRLVWFDCVWIELKAVRILDRSRLILSDTLYCSGHVFVHVSLSDASFEMYGCGIQPLYSCCWVDVVCLIWMARVPTSCAGLELKGYEAYLFSFFFSPLVAVILLFLLCLFFCFLHWTDQSHRSHAA